MLGFIGYINDFANREFNTFYPQIDGGKNLVSMFFNCHSKSIEQVLSSPIPSDSIDFGFSQNILDNWGLPDD